jgi:hypothetical protein
MSDMVFNVFLHALPPVPESDELVASLDSNVYSEHLAVGHRHRFDSQFLGNDRNWQLLVGISVVHQSIFI